MLQAILREWIKKQENWFTHLNSNITLLQLIFWLDYKYVNNYKKC